MIARHARIGLAYFAVFAGGCAGTAAADGPPLPKGRAIANLSSSACMAVLRSHRVPVSAYEGAQAEAVATPLLLTGKVGGITVEHPRRSRVHSVVDCRLVVALLAWAPTLRAASVRGLEHYSILRPGARVKKSGRPSGHSTALAIDVGRFLLDGDKELDVLEDWRERTRDVNPCPQDWSENPETELLRRVVCRAVADDLFQVVITPHHDEHHQNHVHLEVVPDVDWTFIR